MECVNVQMNKSANLQLSDDLSGKNEENASNLHICTSNHL
jgi:hypothetical protein